MRILFVVLIAFMLTGCANSHQSGAFSIMMGTADLLYQGASIATGIPYIPTTFGITDIVDGAKKLEQPVVPAD